MSAKLLASLLTNPPLGWASHVVNAPSSLRQTRSSRPSPLKSPVPSMRQLVGSTAQLLASLLAKLPLPCASQVVKAPSLRRQAMSSRPSALKSPVAATCQLVGSTVKLLASLLTKPPLAWPSQMVKAPSARRQTRSSLPSALKSPTPSTCQPLGSIVQALASLLTKLPFPPASHCVNAPSVLRQTTSSRPSPLKSPVPTTRHSVGSAVKLLASLLAKPPLGCAVNAPLSCRHRTSLRPSPLKSLRTSALPAIV